MSKSENQTRIYTSESTARAFLSDLLEGLGQSHIWWHMAMADVRNRYRRTLLGPIWLSIGMLIFVGWIGFMYSKILNLPLSEYIPHIGVGFSLWVMLASSINEGARTFTDNSFLMRQIPLPLSVLIYRNVVRQITVFLHQIVAVLLLLVIIGFSWHSTGFLAIPGLVLYILNFLWITAFMGILSARFYDVKPILASITQIAFFVTPIIWKAEMMGARSAFLYLNPFNHFIEIVRAPVLGTIPTMANYWVVIGCTIVGWTLTILVYAKFQNRLRYWVL